MTTPATSLFRSRTRSFGLLTALALVGAVLVPVPGCLDDTGTAQPGSECTTGQVEDLDPADCKQRVCTNGKFVEQGDATEIPDDMNPCTLDVCVDGAAQHNAKVDGEMCSLGGKDGTCAAGQCEISCMVASDCVDGNPCTTDACGADMKCDFTPDDNAKPDDDGNPCTDEVCSGGVASHPNSPKDAPCGMAGKCDGNGACAGCTADTDCPVDTDCADNFCDTGTKKCSSMPKPDGPLADNQPGDCKVPACIGGVVDSMPNDADVADDGKACTMDSCSNGMPIFAPLALGASCPTSDNPSGMGKCDGNDKCLGCTQPPDCPADYSCNVATNKCDSCKDTVMNGDEADVDCGGSCIDKCVTGQMCKQSLDCVGECDAVTNLCVDCFDGVKNGTEGDADCGGLCQSKCNTGQSCNVGSDCTQGVCTANKCAAPSCMDGVKNGNETDVDCGNSCPKCANGKACGQNSDCLSNKCDGGTKLCKP